MLLPTISAYSVAGTFPTQSPTKVRGSVDGAYPLSEMTANQASLIGPIPTQSLVHVRFVVGSTPAQVQQRKQPPTDPLSTSLQESKPSVVGHTPAPNPYFAAGISPFQSSRLMFR